MATNRGNKDENSSNSNTSLVSLLTGLGFTVVIFVVGGVLLDNLFHTSPVFILIGVFLGLASIAAFFWKVVSAGTSKS